MSVIVIILAALIGALMSHLGLFVTISKVCVKVFSCTKCVTFWISVIYCLYVCGYPFAKTFCISALASYLSLWIEMFYVWLNKKYSALWEQMLK